jgi:hypothetical protein
MQRTIIWSAVRSCFTGADDLALIAAHIMLVAFATSGFAGPKVLSGVSSRLGEKKKDGAHPRLLCGLNSKDSRTFHQFASGHEEDELAESIAFGLPVLLQFAESGLVTEAERPPESIRKQPVRERLREK